MQMIKELKHFQLFLYGGADNIIAKMEKSPVRSDPMLIFLSGNQPQVILYLRFPSIGNVDGVGWDQPLFLTDPSTPGHFGNKVICDHSRNLA